MASGKKGLPLCILRVLERYASAENPLTAREIIAYLEEDFGLEAERKAVGRNLLLLEEMGFDICGYRENRRGYYIRESRAAFDRNEAQEASPEAASAAVGTEGGVEAEAEDKLSRAVLLDALLRAPQSESREGLIKRFGGRVEIFSLPEQRRVFGLQLAQNLELLLDAIAEKRQISFVNNVLKADGTPTPQRNAAYTANPYAVFLADECYYVIVSIAGYGKPLHYRVDRLTELVILDTPSREYNELIGCEAGLDIREYIMRNIYRSNSSETYTLLCARHLVGELWERFGDGLKMEPRGDNIMLTVEAPWTQVRKFLLLNPKHAVLLEPAPRQSDLRDELSSALACYPR